MKKKFVLILMMIAGAALFAEEKIFRYEMIQESQMYNTMTLSVLDVDHDIGIDFDTSTPEQITALLNRKKCKID